MIDKTLHQESNLPTKESDCLPCGHWNKNYDYPGFDNCVCRDCGQRIAGPPITGQKVFSQ